MSSPESFASTSKFLVSPSVGSSAPMAQDRLAAAVKGLHGKVTFNYPLSELTSFRIGGPADVMVIPWDLADLVKLIKQAKAANIPLFVVGGTNLLIREGGVRGIVIHLSRFHTIQEEAEGIIYAGAGVRMPTLIRHAWRHSLSGLEWAAGIPGSVGGCVVMNAGTRLGEMKDSLSAVHFVDSNGSQKTLAASALKFAYRRSALPPGIVVGAWFKLHPTSKGKIESVMKTYLRQRKATQPLTRPNAGCIFKNPGSLSAGELIEEAGLKGFRVGDAQVSAKHANFIINLGQARATDVLLLIKKIQQTVAQRTGVSLELELTIVGEA